MSNLEERAVIVRHFTSAWTATKVDANLSRAVTDQHQAREHTARVNKRLIDPRAMRAVNAAINSAKVTHEMLTLPWDYGERLLPTAQLPVYKERMAARESEFQKSLNEFIGKYPELKTAAEADLGSMHNPDDYPSEQELRSRFGMSYEFHPIPAASHFVADVGEEEAARIKADLEKRAQMKLDNAMVSLYENVEGALTRLIERLGYDDDGNPNTLHESAVENLREVANSIPNLNLTDDPRLGEISEKISDALKDVGADDLRYKSKNVRAIEETGKRRRKVTRKLEVMAASYFGAPAKAA